MSEEHPKTSAQLNILPGMTPDKMAAYGFMFLEVTRKYALLHENLAHAQGEEPSGRPQKRNKK
jgi:hypothetical protein